MFSITQNSCKSLCSFSVSGEDCESIVVRARAALPYQQEFVDKTFKKQSNTFNGKWTFKQDDKNGYIFWDM